MMLVEINLLPKKEHKKSSKLMIALLMIVIFFASGSVSYFQGSSYEKRMASVNKQIETAQKLNEAQQVKMTEGDSANSAAKLREAAKWAEQYPIETVPLLQKVITLLPERGFIKTFEYSNTNAILITIQFDASRDAAFYLSSLKGSDWVEDVNLLNVIAVTEDEGTATADSDVNLPVSDEEKILPRYTADYEITFRQNLFIKNSSVASKGGDGT